MNKKLIRTLTLVSVVLLIVIMLEWLYAAYAQQQLLESINAPTKQTPPEQMPTITLDAQTEDSYADFVNRPLFVSGRKPIAEADQDQAQTQALHPINNNFDWQLNGIYTTKKGLTALLSRTVAKIPVPLPNGTTAKTSDDKYRKAIVGDSIDSWKVAEIHPYDIIVTQEGGAQKKLLLRKPRTKDAQEPDTVPTPRAMPRTHEPNPATPPVPAQAPPAEPQ